MDYNHRWEETSDNIFWLEGGRGQFMDVKQRQTGHSFYCSYIENNYYNFGISFASVFLLSLTQTN